MKDGPKELHRIVSFLNIKNVKKSLIEKIYRLSSAYKMRKMEIEGKIEGRKKFGNGRNSLKVRRAVVGSYKDEMSLPDIQYCNRLLNKFPNL